MRCFGRYLFWFMVLYESMSSMVECEAKTLGGLRVRRQVPSSLWSNFENCLKEPTCDDIRNVTSVASREDEVEFFIATRSKILKVQPHDFNCTCTLLSNDTAPVYSIAVDDENVYWLAETQSVVMFLSLGLENGVFSRQLSPEMVAENKKVHRAACSTPPYIKDTPAPTSVFAQIATFNLSDVNRKLHSWFDSSICVKEVNPDITFGFLYNDLSNNEKASDNNVCVEDLGCFTKANTSGNQVNATDLEPNTSYRIQLVIYSQADEFKSIVLASSIQISTTCSVPTKPRNLSCRGVNATALRLTWEEPLYLNSHRIMYQVVHRTSGVILDQETVDNGGGNFVHSRLNLNFQSYLVRAYAIGCPSVNGQYEEAEVTGCRPFTGPVRLSKPSATDTKIEVTWNPPEDNGVQLVIIQWIKFSEQNTNSWSSSVPISVNGSFQYAVTDLNPNTPYMFRTRQQYVGHTGNDGWRISSTVTFKTQAGVPSYPEGLQIKKQASGDILTWEEPEDNGESLDNYIITYRNRSAPNSTRALFGDWGVLTLLSHRQTQWVIRDLTEGYWYEFKVSAENIIGKGDSTAPSEPYFYGPASSEIEPSSTLWIIIGAVGGLVLFIVILIFVIACRRCGKKPRIKKMPSSSEITTIHLSYGRDMQLAQLRHMAELANVRGVKGLPKDYLNLLPLFPRDKLELTDFLGKGAFGEVFKGIALDVVAEGEETKVAVKTLREGSTDAEKCEFLMEAYFMSNFHHNNILSLYGVCLDNEPQYLIMELMDGGDLLHYLRGARPNPIMGSKLTTSDLLHICLDVAAGCKYLEDQRFIHRDLAARNCLVNTKLYATENRIVKIGDFGLARDIYKSDYYQKVGEGLLPVRWMAPESLVDNVYTTQSDAWSFGVLLWEIMSFGQQPYPALTNIEVLQHVRNGGKLEVPENCPKDIYALMVKCWHGIPTLRPSFNWALQWLREFKNRNLATVPSGSDYDLTTAVNYTTVTTSDEDFADEGMHTPNHSLSPSGVGYENPSFEQNEHNLISTKALVHTSRTDSGHESLDVIHENGSVIDKAISIPRPTQEFMSMAEDSPDMGAAQIELNYSVLNFPPSRNQSRKSNAGSSSPVMPTLPMEEISGSRTLLPYIGELPITDEERLLRKQQWNEQNRLLTIDVLPATTSQITYNNDSSYLNYNDSMLRAPSGYTQPKQVYQNGGGIVNTSEENSELNERIRVSTHRSGYSNVPTYV